MNKMLTLLSISLILSTASFNSVYAGRTGQTAQEMRLGRCDAAKQVNLQSLALLTARPSSSSVPKRISPAFKLTAFALAILLVISPIEAALVNGGSTLETKKHAPIHSNVQDVSKTFALGEGVCDSSRACCKPNFGTTNMCVAGLLPADVMPLQYEKTLIEINGQNKLMLGHIVQLGFDLSDGKENLFAHTDIFRYDAEKHTFIRKGTVTSMDEQSLQEIGSDNYVYTPMYTMRKVDSSYAEFGAIIVGSKDAQLAERLHFASMQSMIELHKKSLSV
jgi:hypothetical protein